MCGAFGRSVIAQLNLERQLTDSLGKVSNAQGFLPQHALYQPDRIKVKIIEAPQRLRDV